MLAWAVPQVELVGRARRHHHRDMFWPYTLNPKPCHADGRFRKKSLQRGKTLSWHRSSDDTN